MAEDPSCRACGQPLWLRNGCTSPFTGHTIVHGARVLVDQLVGEQLDPAYLFEDCGDCSVRVDERHHLGCTYAVCSRSNQQALWCECPLCDDANEAGYAAALAARGEVEWKVPE